MIAIAVMIVVSIVAYRIAVAIAIAKLSFNPFSSDSEYGLSILQLYLVHTS